MDKTVERTFDLCVIGCGPAGFAGAIRAVDLGKRVCIVEAGELGGAGVKWGALASKTMWELAKDYAVAAAVDRGYRAGSLTVDYAAVRETVLNAVLEKQRQMEKQFAALSPEKHPEGGSITVIRGTAAFAGRKEVAVVGKTGERSRVRAERILIATGSKPRWFDHVPVDGKRVFDSGNILSLEAFPRRLTIIGAGVIGCEYATIFSNFGQTEVILVDHKDRVIPYEDRDVGDFVRRRLQKNGVKIIHTASLREVRPKGGRTAVVLDFTNGESRTIETDALLISIGRVPNLSELNLEAAEIPFNPDDRRLAVDCYGRVDDGVYAAGDVSDHPALVNVAEMEGRLAVMRMFGRQPSPINFENLPTVMFFKPAVAAVGLTEKQLRKKNRPYRVAVYGNALLARAITMRTTSGFVKIITDMDEKRRILGMRAAGPQVSSTIMSIAHCIDLQLGIEDVLKTIHPHPTMAEGIQECLRLLMGTSVYKPAAFPDLLRVRTWRPDTGYTECEGGDLTECTL